MGEAVHIIWIKRGKEKGFHSPEECFVLKTWQKHKPNSQLIPDSSGCYCPSCNTYMRPRKDLSPKDKELELFYVREFFRILDDMGYEVVRRGKP